MSEEFKSARRVGSAFLCWRTSRSLSQEQAAELAGIDVKTYGRLERGQGATLSTFLRVWETLAPCTHEIVSIFSPAQCACNDGVVAMGKSGPPLRDMRN